MQDKGKAIFAFLYMIAAVLVPFFDGRNGPPDGEGWVQIAIGVVTAFSVYMAPVIPEARWTKTLIGVALAGLQVLATSVLGGITGAEALLVAAAIASALGITIAPATSDNGVHVGWGSDSARGAVVR